LALAASVAAATEPVARMPQQHASVHQVVANERTAADITGKCIKRVRNKMGRTVAGPPSFNAYLPQSSYRL
jgi:hypothetical protein